MQGAPGGAGLVAWTPRGREWAGPGGRRAEGLYRRGIQTADHNMCTEEAGAQGVCEADIEKELRLGQRLGVEVDTGLQPGQGEAEKIGLLPVLAQVEVHVLACSCVMDVNLV